MEKDIKAGNSRLAEAPYLSSLQRTFIFRPQNPYEKMEEAVITWRMEKILSKKRILELYLNVVEWGDTGISGIEAAAGHHYGKPASALT